MHYISSEAFLMTTEEKKSAGKICLDFEAFFNKKILLIAVFFFFLLLYYIVVSCNLGV